MLTKRAEQIVITITQNRRAKQAVATIMLVSVEYFYRPICKFSWTLHPDALEIVDPSVVSIRKGSLVLVIDDADVLRQLQDDRHGNWNDAMLEVRTHCYSMVYYIIQVSHSWGGSGFNALRFRTACI